MLSIGLLYHIRFQGREAVEKNGAVGLGISARRKKVESVALL
jgi:hypothetical protein